jgi:hypothetical protein
MQIPERGNEHDATKDDKAEDRPAAASDDGYLCHRETEVLRQIALIQQASTIGLKQRWRELFGKEPPAFSRSFLQSRLAYRVQELAYGGLKPETVARLEDLGERLDGGNVVLRRTRADDRPIAGTRLLREHQGIEHVVTVLVDGFDYCGRPYRSLSAIARAITGAQWNGWTFFGLNKKRSAT